MSQLETTVRTEIEALHDFFTLWFSGKCGQDRDLFDMGLTSRMAEDVLLIQPGGGVLGKASFCDAVWKGYGFSPQFRIAIRNVELRPIIFEDYVLVTYEEWQRGAVNSTPPDNGRLASVLFSVQDERPAKWLHIHETWLPKARYTQAAFDF